MFDWLRGVIGLREAIGRSEPVTIGLSGVSVGGLQVQPPVREWTPADLSWLHPPKDVLDSQAWDRYWNDQVAHGLRSQLFDLFTDDRDLIAYMTSRGFRSALCVGSGISQEPRALAAAGFDVTALDLSPAAARLAQAVPLNADLLNSLMDVESRRAGGTLSYVTGNLLDAAVCPGPFDVIIERRTVQLYLSRGGEFGDALEVLARRMRPDGLFVSHCHDGGWKGPGPPVHVAQAWFRDQGWTTWRGNLRDAPHERVASLSISTG